MRIGILGSGLMGGKLGTLFARSGHEVVFSYSRSRQKLDQLAVHWSRVDEVLTQAGDVAGKEAGGSSVVSAFSTVPSEVLFPVYNARGAGVRPNLLYCGDDDEAKAVAAGLIRDVGFDPTDVGPLSSARYIEPYTMLIAKLAYEGESGPELAYRFEQFGGRRAQ